MADLLRDEFTTIEAAPIASPRTAEPGPGTLVAVDDESKMPIEADGLRVQPLASVLWGAMGIRTQSKVSQSAGRIAGLKFNFSSVNEAAFFFSASDSNDPRNADDLGLDVNTGSQLRFFGSGNTAATVVATLASDTEYELALVRRGNGLHVLIKGGAFAESTLLFVDATLSVVDEYLHLASRRADGHISRFVVPETLWTPTPLASDSFDRSDSSDIGSTDGAGVEESGGDGLAWTESGDAVGEIFSNRFSNGQAGTFGDIATVECGQANILKRCAVRRTGAGTALSGLILRYLDDDNYWQVDFHSGGNFRILEKNSGTFTTRASVAKTFSVDTNYEILAVADGTTITAYIDGGNRISYSSASLNQNETKHGVKAYNDTAANRAFVDNFAVFNRVQADFPSLAATGEVSASRLGLALSSGLGLGI